MEKEEESSAPQQGEALAKLMETRRVVTKELLGVGRKSICNWGPQTTLIMKTAGQGTASGEGGLRRSELSGTLESRAERGTKDLGGRGLCFLLWARL